MRIAACLGVKDEVELIEPCIAHLRSIGVDIIIACDMNSTDGTGEVLDRYRSDRDFWIFRLDDQINDGFEAWMRVAMALIKSAGVEWAVFLDADEFWIPASGSLKDCGDLSGTDVLSVDRFNVPMSASGLLMPRELIPEYYGELFLYVEPSEYLKGQLESDPAARWIRGAAESKVMVRPERIGAVELGTHVVYSADSTPLRRTKPSNILIAHLPFTTRSRFKRKIGNIRKVFRAHDVFQGDIAWHWRRWLELDDRREIDAEYDRSLLSPESIPDLRRAGTIRSAADLFVENGALASLAHDCVESGRAES